MEALSNIYLNSVRELVIKVGKLNQVEFDYEFRSKNAGILGGDEGEKPQKRFAQGPNPLFALNGLCEFDEIPESSLEEVEVERFVPDTSGKREQE